MEVFRMLDTLRPTATGLDQIPACFLRLGACAHLRRTTRSFVLPITCSRRRAAPVKNRHHNVGTQDRHASTAERLPANIDHAGIVAVPIAVRRQEVYLPGSAQAVSLARLQRPVCVQAIGLDDGCYHGRATHRALYAGQQRLRSRLLIRLFEGVRYCPTRVADE